MSFAANFIFLINPFSYMIKIFNILRTKSALKMNNTIFLEGDSPTLNI